MLSIKGFVLDSLRAVRNSYRTNQQFFDGVYKNYTDVPETAGYNDESWYNICTVNSNRAKSEIGSIFPRNLTWSKALLPVLVCGMGKEVTILDFGGAGGLDYANLMSQTSRGVHVKYNVVDVSQACKAGREVFKGDPNVSFSTEIPDVTPDIIYSYSAIHTMPDWKENLTTLAKLGAKNILLCKHPITTQTGSFVRKQVNMGKGLEVAQWVLSLNDIEDTLKPYGYTLTFRSIGEDVYNVDNFRNPYKAPNVANLLFQRN